MQQQSEMAKFFICPLSQEIMFDPVIASDGKTYEREKIEEYFAANKGKKLLSPMDNKTEMTTVLICNDGMRGIIQEFLTMNPSMKGELYFPESIKQECEETIKTHNNKLKRLLEREPRLLEAIFSNKKTILQLASEHGNLDVIKLIAEKLKKANQFQITKNVTLELLTSCYLNKNIGASGIARLVENILEWEQSAIIDFFKEMITFGELGLVKILVESKLVDPNNGLDGQKNTALHIAASFNRTEIVKYLINKGANTKEPNIEGKMAERIASEAGHQELAKNILQWRKEKKLEPMNLKLENVQQENEHLKAKVQKLEEEMATIKLLVGELRGSLFPKATPFNFGPVPSPTTSSSSVSPFADTPFALNLATNSSLMQSKLPLPKIPPQKLGFTFFSESKPADKRQLTGMEQERQNQFIILILKGDIEKVKALHKEGALLNEPDKNQVYPLVAAAYSTSMETLKYIESNLEGEANQYWAKVDRSKVERCVNAQIPEKRPENAMEWLGMWYGQHRDRRWCSIYDLRCLELTNSNRWDNDYVSWSARSKAHSSSRGLLNLTEDNINLRHGDNWGGKRILHWPSARTHDQVVSEITESLYQFSQYVQNKVVASESVVKCQFNV